jgi:hypothetical protein
MRPSSPPRRGVTNPAIRPPVGFPNKSSPAPLTVIPDTELSCWRPHVRRAETSDTALCTQVFLMISSVEGRFPHLLTGIRDTLFPVLRAARSTGIRDTKPIHTGHASPNRPSYREVGHGTGIGTGILSTDFPGFRTRSRRERGHRSTGIRGTESDAVTVIPDTPDRPSGRERDELRRVTLDHKTDQTPQQCWCSFFFRGSR